MVKYDYSYQLGDNQGSGQTAQKKYIILHDTGNANNVGSNSAQNEASYMHNNWTSAYTHAIAGHDRVYIIGEPGYVAWGALSGNPYSPFQIELARYSDRTLALKAYKNWVDAAREMAKKYDISLVLDGSGNGVKSHDWISKNLGGDHVDPYGYLSSIGISKAQLQADLLNGTTTDKPFDENTSNKGIVTVNYNGVGKVRLMNSKGQHINTYVDKNSRWKVTGFSKYGVQIGTNAYLPYMYAKIVVDYTKGYGVNAVDSKAKMIDGTNKTFKEGTSWRVTNGYMKSGMAYFKVGGKEYIMGKYTR